MFFNRKFHEPEFKMSAPEILEIKDPFIEEIKAVNESFSKLDIYDLGEQYEKVIDHIIDRDKIRINLDQLLNKK